MRKQVCTLLTYQGQGDKLFVLPFNESYSPQLGKNNECQIKMLTEKLMVECQMRLDEYGGPRWFNKSGQGPETRYVFGGRR